MRIFCFNIVGAKVKMMYKISKNTVLVGSYTIKYSLAIPFLTACSYADMPKEVLTEIHNKLCYVE